MDETPVGPGNPPKASQFKKGHSGNPRGRPRRKVESPPYESVLGRMIVIKDENGLSRQMTVEEAFVRRLAGRGMQDDLIANKYALQAINGLRAIHHPDAKEDDTLYIQLTGGPDAPQLNRMMLKLRMIRKRKPDSASPYILLEQWLVQMALARFGERQLTVDEQREVWENARTPHKVEWPSWWTERRGTGRRRPKRPLIAEDGSYPPCIRPKRRGAYELDD